MKFEKIENGKNNEIAIDNNSELESDSKVLLGNQKYYNYTNTNNRVKQFLDINDF